jgi:hypothetical protein
MAMPSLRQHQPSEQIVMLEMPGIEGPNAEAAYGASYLHRIHSKPTALQHKANFRSPTLQLIIIMASF